MNILKLVLTGCVFCFFVLCRLDPYAGLSKVNTPLQTPLTLSLEEWCTLRSAKGQQYQLFGVVMHSGVTISSGHYTAYVRMSELRDVKLSLGDDDAETKEEEEEDKGDAPDYDDGEVSFSVSLRGQRASSAAKTGGKKLSEGGVGLLGGQRSLSTCDLGNNKAADKAVGGGTAEGSKRRRTIGSMCQSPDAGLKKDPDAEHGAQTATEKQALSRLMEYDGKWMLFDDSEVRLFEEDEFLRACSPETASSSTPYLLFYRRIPGHGH